MTEPTNAVVAGPREIVERMRRGMLGEGGGAEFAADAVYETPFGLPGRPRRFERREAIQNHFASRASDELSAAMRTLNFQTVDAIVDESTDPEIVTFSFDISGTSRVTGTPFRFTSTIGVLTVRDGQIVYWRDYPNFVGAAEAADVLPTLAKLLTGPQAE